MNNSPDWRVTVAVAFLGPLVGILFKWLLDTRTERIKWDREHQARYNTQRIEAYSKFLALGNGIAADRKSARARNLLEVSYKDDKHWNDVDEFLRLMHLIEVIATPEVRDAANRYGMAVTSPTDLDADYAAKNLRRAVRQELGVPLQGEYL